MDMWRRQRSGLHLSGSKVCRLETISVPKGWLFISGGSASRLSEFRRELGRLSDGYRLSVDGRLSHSCACSRTRGSRLETLLPS